MSEPERIYTAKSLGARYARLCDDMASVRAYDYERSALLAYNDNGQRHIAENSYQDVLLDQIEERGIIGAVLEEVAARSLPHEFLAWFLVRVEFETHQHAADVIEKGPTTIANILRRVDGAVSRVLDEREMLKTWRGRDLVEVEVEGNDFPRGVRVHVDYAALAEYHRLFGQAAE